MIFVFCVSFVIAIIYLLMNKHYKKFQLFRFNKDFGFELLQKIFKIGVPISIQIASELSAFTFSIFMVGWLGQVPLAATQIINQLNMIMIMGPYGISLASNVLISQDFGKGDKNSIRTLGNASMFTGFVFTAIVAMFYIAFPEQFISLYSVNISNPANLTLIKIATLLFFIGAFSQIFDGIRNIVIGSLRGLQDTVTPMWYGIISCWFVGIPLCYLLGIEFKFGAPGISMAFLVSWLICSIFLIARFYNKTNVT